MKRMTYEQNIKFIPLLGQLSKKYKINSKIDCSFFPMLCYHDIKVETLKKMMIFGCEAANVILGILSNGNASACSFLIKDSFPALNLPEAWDTDPLFNSIRKYHERAKEPCRSCKYLKLCKGGCHAVSYIVTGDIDAPDPDCPFVVEYNKRKKS